tara:strand:- start:71 stop:616 length:546 start_codon:yes stop_codon:yes gene_type:complete
MLAPCLPPHLEQLGRLEFVAPLKEWERLAKEVRALQQEVAAAGPRGDERGGISLHSKLSADGLSQQLAAKTQFLSALRLRLRSRVRELEILYGQSSRDAAPNETSALAATRNLEMLRRVILALDKEQNRTDAFGIAATLDEATWSSESSIMSRGQTAKPVPQPTRTWSIGGNKITMPRVGH